MCAERVRMRASVVRVMAGYNTRSGACRNIRELCVINRRNDTLCVLQYIIFNLLAFHHHPSTGPVRVPSVDDFSTQDTYLEQIYLLLHIIESRL
jgi:hypothetical protein